MPTPTAITAGFLDLAWLLLYPLLYVFRFFVFFGSLEPLKLFKSSFVFLAVLFFGSFVFLAVLFFGSFVFLAVLFFGCFVFLAVLFFGQFRAVSRF